jgi:osmotically-inducible protein OsmY
MSDYNRYRRGYERPEENEGYSGQGNYNQPNYGTHSRDRYGRPYGEEMNRGYSSYGAQEENPYRDTRYRSDYGDQYEGNFSGSNYDRDFDFGMNRRGRQQYYGSYNSLDYDDIDRRHDWRPSDRRQDWRNNPSNMGVGSNYAYNRGGYGSNFGGEYGHFPQRNSGSGYSGEFGNASYGHQRRDSGYGHPDREYSSYRGRFDRDYERSWERDNRDWWDRTRDEVASWFGDEEAERRRRLDKYQGEHRGRGPKGYRRSDNRIEEDINDRLADDGWVDASDVTVNVQNGEVTLTGSAPDRFSKRRAEDIAEAVSGVRNVENRIRVTQQEMPQAASYRGTDSNSDGRTSSGSNSVSNGKSTTRPAL